MYDKRIAKDINVDESTFEEVMDSIYYDEGSEFLHLILSKDFVLAKKRFEEYEKRMKIIKNDNTQSFDELEECAGCHKLTNQVLFDDLCDECSDF